MLNQAINLGNLKHKLILKVFSIGCIICGAGALLTTIIYFSMQSTPIDVEWPIEHSENAITLKNDLIIVPHSYFPRVQVYNKSLEYIRGWRITSGNTFWLIPASDDTFYVQTARGNHQYLFNVNGKLISSETYIEERSAPEALRSNISLSVPVYLTLFMNPFYMVGLFAFGMFVFVSLRVCKPNKKIN